MGSQLREEKKDGTGTFWLSCSQILCCLLSTGLVTHALSELIDRLKSIFSAAVLLRVIPGVVNGSQAQQPERKEPRKRKVRNICFTNKVFPF